MITVLKKYHHRPDLSIPSLLSVSSSRSCKRKLAQVFQTTQSRECMRNKQVGSQGEWQTERKRQEGQ